MGAIIAKEIRENLKWALFMLLALSAAMAYAVHNDGPQGLSLVGNTMVMVSAVSFPTIGFALGLLQVLQDYRLGRWGFLIHRPISRTRIFFAKVIAGLLLYALASAPPLGVVAAWVATPGHLSAPFDWHMTLPRLSDLVGGIVWYFTGLLVAAREARWIGSRLMPIGLAFLISTYASIVSFAFWQALLFFAAGIGILLPAAWTAFTARGTFERQPPITRGLQVISVAVGMALFTGAATAILISAIEWIAPPRAPANVRYQAYDMKRDGKVLRMTYGGTGPVEKTDLQGRPVPIQTAPTQPRLRVPIQLEGFLSDQSDWGTRRIVEGLQNSDSYVLPLGEGGSHQWFYLTQRRVIEGFDPAHHYIGSIGPEGFEPPSKSATPFPNAIQPTARRTYFQWGGGTWLELASHTTVYQVELSWREIRVLFKTTPGDPILTAPEAVAGDDGKSELAVVVTRSRIHVLNPADGKELFNLPIEHSYPQCQAIDVVRTNDGRFVISYWKWSGSGGPTSGWVVETNESGHVLRRIELPPLVNEPRRHEPTWTDALQNAALPPFLAVLSYSLNERLRSLAVLAVALVSLASAAITLLLCRRHAFKRSATIVWTSFNLLTGIPGILTLLSLRPLPPRVRCPQCARLRVVSREICEHCGATFAPPPQAGTEILEMV